MQERGFLNCSGTRLFLKPSLYFENSFGGVNFRVVANLQSLTLLKMNPSQKQRQPFRRCLYGEKTSRQSEGLG